MTTLSTRARKGAAAVEFAICFPVVAFIIVAAMDVIHVQRTHQAIIETTHEIARVIATNDVDEEQCHPFANDLLEAKSLSNATVTFDPVPSPTMPRGTPITVSVIVPIDGNCTDISRLFTSQSLDSHSIVSREIGLLVPTSPDDND